MEQLEELLSVDLKITEVEFEYLVEVIPALISNLRKSIAAAGERDIFG